MENPEDYYEDLYEEENDYEDCPKCGKWFDSIDFDFQICSRCGWDGSK